MEKINGRYQAVYTNKAIQNGGYITFKGDTFKMEPFQFLPYEGKIEYYESLTTMVSDFNRNLIIDFSTADITKDTIPFQVHDSRSGLSYLEFSVDSGKFIKVK